MNGYITIEELGDLSLDFAYSATPIVSSYQIDFFNNGTFFTTTYGEDVPDLSFTEMEVDESTSNMVQFDMSCYSAESIYLTLFDNGWLKFTLTHDELNLLTTTTFDKLFEGLVDKYGDDQPMDIAFSAYTTPRCEFTEG